MLVMHLPSSPQIPRKYADNALDLITVEVEPQPVVTGPLEAHQPDAPALHGRGNLLSTSRSVKGMSNKGLQKQTWCLSILFKPQLLNTSSWNRSAVLPVQPLMERWKFMSARKSPTQIASRWPRLWVGRKSV